MANNEYVAPKIDVVNDVKPVKAETAVAKRTIVDQPEVIVTNVSFYKSEVDKYFPYLLGEIGFANKKDAQLAARSFIDLTGRTVGYEYKEFEGCFLILINKFLEHPYLFKDGVFHGHLSDAISSGYPSSSVDQYRTYTNFIMRIASSWPTRAKQARLVDIEVLSKNMRSEARENLFNLVRLMGNFKINL